MFPTGCEIPLILVKSDGGNTYDTSDLAAIYHRLIVEKHDWVIYVVDAGQSLHLEVLLFFLKWYWRRCWSPILHVISLFYFLLQIKIYKLFSILDRFRWRKRSWLVWSKVEESWACCFWTCSWRGQVSHWIFLGASWLLPSFCFLLCRKKFKTRSGETVKLTDLLNEGVKRATAKLREKEREKVHFFDEICYIVYQTIWIDYSFSKKSIIYTTYTILNSWHGALNLV